MSLITIPNVFTVGAVIVASQHNSNFSVIYSDYNGNITTANIAANAGIVDTQLAQITTASKVNLSALTITSQAQGDIIYASGASALTRLGAGTSGQVLQTQGAGANPLWVNALSSVSDYGTSASASTAKQATAVKIAYGVVTFGGGSQTQAITNLPFTSSSTYVVFATTVGSSSFSKFGVVNNSGSQFTLSDDINGQTVQWFAIGT